MNLDQRGWLHTVSVDALKRSPHTWTERPQFDSDDIALIARTLNAAADAALFPQQAVPLRKLADPLTDAMENR